MKHRNQCAAIGIMVVLTGSVLSGIFTNIYAQSKNIKNDVFWNTRDGQPVYSQGGGIFRFTDPVTDKTKYYWYGVHYKEAELYRQSPWITYPNATFEAVTCYSSVDLVNWTFEGNVLTRDEVNKGGRTWLGRLGVAYLPQLKKYAMLIQHGSQVLVTVADSPTAAFHWHRQINMEPMIGTTNTGDQTVFTDEDSGISYLVYSYGKGRNRIYVSEIGVKEGLVTLLDCTQVCKGESREGNCMFKYKGRYYMCASNIYGWDASYAYYLVADNIRGPYEPANDMQVMNGCAGDYAHISQTGFFLTLKGSKEETVIYCGDRWADFAGNGLGYNQWCPLSFDGKTPHFNSLNSWNLNVQTGKWNVAADNNYVKNGSFEADRKTVPSNNKPVQEQLTGWTTQVVKGTAIATGSSASPELNHSNSEEDRKQVIGEKSLNISDSIAFQRKTFQVISSTPFVKIEDGTYTLTAKIRNSNGFSRLLMYAEANGKTVSYEITKENPSWQTISIPEIKVKGGRVEVGFIAEGDAKASCYVDDVSLVKKQ